ncbi:MAG: AP2 domain-containing protein [Planctomycetota bacterium]
MKTIELTQGQVALVDDSDFDELDRYKWHALWDPCTQSFYAVRNVSIEQGKQTLVSMGREILGLERGDNRQCDHKNHNTLDNRRCVLRICSRQQNYQNSRKYQTHAGRKCSSIYKGVNWFKRDKKWKTHIAYNGKQIHLGYFVSEIEAAKAYDNKARELFGEYANLNFKDKL